MNEIIYYIIGVLILASVLAGTFIYVVHDDAMDEENSLVQLGISRNGSYVLFFLFSVCIFTIPAGMIYVVDHEKNKGGAE